jgi:hypothetical protein
MEIQSKAQIEAPDPLKQVAAFPLATSNHEIGEHQHRVIGMRMMLEGLVLRRF